MDYRNNFYPGTTQTSNIFKQCVSCQSDETVEHTFISYPFVRNIWKLIHFTFNISPPYIIANMFVDWLNGVDKKTKPPFRICV